MPVDPIPDVNQATFAAMVNKINELVSFVNHIQRAGTGAYMVWVGDGDVIAPKPLGEELTYE